MNSVLFYNGLPSPDAVRAAMKRQGATYPDSTSEERKAEEYRKSNYAIYQANYRKRQKKLNPIKP